MGAAGRELALCPKLPALDAGAAILQEIRLLREHMDRKFEIIRMEARARDANNAARLANSTFTKDNQELIPLVSLENNPIPGFPRLAGGIANMSRQGLDAVLEALGIPMQGTLQVKRQALKLHIGLPTIS
ncbi:hypothetical protein MMC08_002036 [Hypocenomyce scalaris]|nr:hypothetical protein [Hypocenomyce scalaris]